MGLFSQIDAVEIIKRDKQIASLTAEIERLRKAITDHIEAHDWSAVDPIDRGYPDVDDLRAALQAGESDG